MVARLIGTALLTFAVSAQAAELAARTETDASMAPAFPAAAVLTPFSRPFLTSMPVPYTGLEAGRIAALGTASVSASAVSETFALTGATGAGLEAGRLKVPGTVSGIASEAPFAAPLAVAETLLTGVAGRAALMPEGGPDAAPGRGASLTPLSAARRDRVTRQRVIGRASLALVSAAQRGPTPLFATSAAVAGLATGTAQDASADSRTPHALAPSAAHVDTSAPPVSAGEKRAGAEAPASSPAAGTAAVSRRVVSVNLCTDQLAMMLAAPGQLVSISHLASDPRSSAMTEEAARYPHNHGLAEEIVLLQPDLVLAGRYGSAATTALLRRIGVPVEVFDPETSLAGIRDNVRRMGAALGRTAEAESLVKRFDADLAALGQPPADRRRAALYYANGYTAGDASLAGEILAAAGLANIASELGLRGGGMVSLEQLVLADPDLIIRGERYAGSSRAEDLLDHPALAALAGAAQGALADGDWVCGTPHVIDAVRRLRDRAAPP
ncbi:MULTISPECIES: ABC transporter substrate-binding protein [unclassified Haematobacter]|uniref:ABC transporter substrate-binding protein n=1 Tax=unclassified Haematobacter TaxID=2640585 RepID=UPI0025B7B056|nr:MULTISPECIES: ABC transporter substrate-binding protein [unclassified Haematobacter]